MSNKCTYSKLAEQGLIKTGYRRFDYKHRTIFSLQRPFLNMRLVECRDRFNLGGEERNLTQASYSQTFQYHHEVQRV